MFTESAVVVTLPPQLPYLVGHVVIAVQIRGVAPVSHVSLNEVQSAQELPPDPHRVSTNPAKQVFAWQQPAEHVDELHLVMGMTQAFAWQVSLVVVQS